MDVYTHFLTHIYVQTTCKVNFASDDPFKLTKLSYYLLIYIFYADMFPN